MNYWYRRRCLNKYWPIPIPTDTGKYRPIPDTIIGLTLFFSNCAAWNEFILLAKSLLIFFQEEMNLSTREQKHRRMCAVQEMQQTMGILNPKQSLPELSEVFTKLFSSASSQVRASKKVSKVNKPVKKRSWRCLGSRLHILMSTCLDIVV